FLQAIAAAPKRAAIRKDLAYTYLKIGENDLAREQFHEAMALDPADDQVAMEYAFLCYETKQQAEARRIFDRIRRKGNVTAEQAFHNIDAPLAAGIERWQQAIAMGSDNFSAHFELATLAEQRDEPALAAEHYEKAWRLLPDRRSVLVDLGRVWHAQKRMEQANAALLAASRGGEPRAAEMARELLPERYPYVSEFRAALALDPANVELRRELGYLLLRMDNKSEAEQEFRWLAEHAPEDLLSATQLGFLLYARGDHDGAVPLFQRVLAGKDEELANRVRAVLHMPQLAVRRPEAPPQSIDAKVMAERSLKAGYLKDAVKYLEVAHEADPGDFDIMRKLGWGYNLLRQDALARRWFALARKSPDPEIAADADHAWHNLRTAVMPFRVTAWFYPIYSTRWQDFFGYAQVKAELRTHWPIVPYASVRFVGDTRVDVGPALLSESSFIAGVGVHSVPWRGITGWFEAGSAISYVQGHMLPDYRGGVNVTRGIGHGLMGETDGWFADTTFDGVYISRFGNDFLMYSQSRAGYTLGPRSFRSQFYWSGNLTLDVRSQTWANFGETGGGVRVHQAIMPQSMYVTANLLRGSYLRYSNASFSDFRLGVWYAFSY
ncbi:MAG TPA: tetratricopeptide repeat protein, partial [Candidatus Sulfopaludibacter sp.]|nr:tetratricopeptide repeat protein [Candidatus Sulfopaludibacter sp.]